MDFWKRLFAAEPKPKHALPGVDTSASIVNTTMPLQFSGQPLEIKADATPRPTAEAPRVSGGPTRSSAASATTSDGSRSDSDKIDELIETLEKRWPGSAGNVFCLLFKDERSARAIYNSLVHSLGNYRSQPLLFWGNVRWGSATNSSSAAVGVMCWDSNSSEIQESLAWFHSKTASIGKVAEPAKFLDISLSAMKSSSKFKISDFVYIGKYGPAL